EDEDAGDRRAGIEIERVTLDVGEVVRRGRRRGGQHLYRRELERGRNAVATVNESRARHRRLVGGGPAGAGVGDVVRRLRVVVAERRVQEGDDTTGVGRRGRGPTITVGGLNEEVGDRRPRALIDHGNRERAGTDGDEH